MPKRWLIAACIVAGVPTSACAGEAFVGRWAVTASACNSLGSTPATAPLVASDTSVSWYGGTCRMHKIYKLGHVVYAQAICLDGRNIPITLDAVGDRMKVSWDRAKIEELRRCK